MQQLHQPMVVAVVDHDADNHWAVRFESFLERGRDLITPFYTQSFCAERLGKPDHIDWTKSPARKPPIFHHFLNANHVVKTVNPDQANEVAFEPNGSLKFHCRK